MSIYFFKRKAHYTLLKGKPAPLRGRISGSVVRVVSICRVARSFAVFHEQRDPVLEQHETSVGVSAERAILSRHQYYHVRHERRSHQSVQPSDPRIVGGGR